MKRSSGSVWRVLTSLAIGIAVALVYLRVDTVAFQADSLALDSLTATRLSPGTVDPRLVLLEIDDDSLADLGGWPLPRSVYARIVSALEAAGAKCIAFDILFTERSENPQDDAAFVDAVSRFNVVLPIEADSVNVEMDKQREILDTSIILAPPDAEVRFEDLSVLSPPFAELAFAASGLGHVMLPPDRDDVTRRVPLLRKGPDGLIPSLSLRLAMNALNVTPDQVEVLATGELQMPVPGESKPVRVPVDERGHMLLSFPGAGAEGMPCQSFAAQLSALEEFPEDMRRSYEGKIVFVGASFQLSGDLGMTRSSGQVPLFQLHAAATNAILTGRFLRAVQRLVVAAAAAVLPLIIGGLYGGRALSNTVATFLLIALFLGISWALFNFAGLVVSFLPAVAALAITGVANVAHLYRGEVRLRKHVRDALSKFAPSELVDFTDNRHRRIDSSLRTRRELTVFFVDLVDFTRYCDESEPEEVVDALDDFYRLVADAVQSESGYISKMLGDGMLCLFDKPRHGSKEGRSGRAAHKIMSHLELLNAQRRRQGMRPLETRIGIGTGHVTVGVVGGGERLDYTVIGRVVNLSSRLASAAAPNGVMADGSTAARLKASAVCRLTEQQVDLKGINRPVTAYVVSFPDMEGARRDDDHEETTES